MLLHRPLFFIALRLMTMGWDDANASFFFMPRSFPSVRPFFMHAAAGALTVYAAFIFARCFHHDRLRWLWLARFITTDSCLLGIGRAGMNQFFSRNCWHFT
jgi:hypothetical protein